MNHLNQSKIEAIMSLTERERVILQLSGQGLSDYKIARKINTDPPSITRSRKNAHRKLSDAIADIEWASKAGLTISEFTSTIGNGGIYSYFL
jgi:DNA-binding CsgD family transcriptional regulator